MPAAAQTVTIAATGKCSGTPANCGTSGNRNGDLDTTWPGLQVDEGDTLTFTSTISPDITTTNGFLLIEWRVSGSARNTADLRRTDGLTWSPSTAIIAAR